MIYLLAAVLIGLAELLILTTVRPRPSSPLEFAYLAAPAAGVAVLLVFAWRSVAG